MSILGQATQPAGVPWGELMMFAPPAVVSLVIAAFAGVFRRRSIVGPPRIADRESVGAPLIILGAGFVIWIGAQVACVMPAHPTAAAPAPSTEPAAAVVATQPSTTRAAAVELSPRQMAIAATVPAIVAGLFMLLANAVLRPGGLARMGVSPRSMRRGLWQGFVGGVIVVPLIYFVAQVTEVAWRAVGYEHPKEHDLLRIMGESEHMPLVALVLIASAVLVAPLFEELLFRGHLQTVVTHALARLSGRETRVPPGEYEIVVPTREAGAAPDYAAPGAVKAGEPIPVNAPAAAARWAAVFLTSLVFASVHPAWTIPPIFVLSLCLGYAYERTGNLWAVMTMHAMFNTTSTVIYLLMSR